MYAWSITMDDYIKVVELARENGKTPGDSLEEEFLAYMKEKDKQPMGKVNSDAELFAANLRESGKKVVNLSELLRHKGKDKTEE